MTGLAGSCCSRRGLRMASRRVSGPGGSLSPWLCNVMGSSWQAISRGEVPANNVLDSFWAAQEIALMAKA